MVETIENFEKRSYINFVDKIAFVWPSSDKKGKCEKWDLQTARNYVSCKVNETRF